MQVNPLLLSRRITLLPCASVSTIRADLEISSGPADIARAIFSCVVSLAFAGIPLCGVFDSALPTNLIPIIRNRAMDVMALVKNLRLELLDLMASRCTLRASSGSLFCNQHHAEPCFALHHASVSVSSLLERSCLDHRADILQDAEGKRVFGIDCSAGQASVNRPPSKNKRERI